MDPAVPFGVFKMSGYGRESDIQQLDDYLSVEAVWIRTAWGRRAAPRGRAAAPLLAHITPRRRSLSEQGIASEQRKEASSPRGAESLRTLISIGEAGDVGDLQSKAA